MTGTLTIMNPVDVRERLHKELPPGVLEHVDRTAHLARKLAAVHGVDRDQAELAALLHDIGDRYSDVELLILAERFELPISLTEARVPKLLHGKIAAEILRREWGITDEELLDAIAEHITGGVRMSPLAKVLFVADKLEPGRDRHYHGLDPIRELAMVDLDAALLRLYAWRMDELVRGGQPIDSGLVAARNRLIDRSLAIRR
jgi:predicted HD superfamily hydrolase involved in NAD metabolism